MQIQWTGLIDERMRNMQETYAKDAFLWKLLVKPFRGTPDDARLSWKGEFWGKFMRGCALICAYTQDDELYAVLEKTVRDLLTTQDELGRIATYSVEKEFNGWDIWSRKYVMLGMQYFLDICRDAALEKQIVSALKKHADYIIDRVGYTGNKIPVHQTSAAWGAANSSSILQPMVKLYKKTGDEKYLNWAKEIIRYQNVGEENLFALAFENKKAPFEYNTKKAYEIISCFEGLLEFYEVTNNADCLTACINVADRLLETEYTLIGGVGHFDEYFNNGTKMQVQDEKPWAVKQETCVTVTFCKYLAQLYAHTGKAAYIDAIERGFYNLYLGAYNDGSYQHNQVIPIFYSYSPVINNVRWQKVGGNQSLAPYAYFGCCIAIGFAGIGIMPSLALKMDEDTAYLGTFEGGRYASNDETLVLNVQSGYPYDGSVNVKVERADDIKTLKIRVPAWCKKYAFTRNKKGVEAAVNDGWLETQIAAGDELVFTMDMPYVEVSSADFNEQVNNYFAVEKGPLVLCADSNEVDLEAGHALAKDENGHLIGESEDGKLHRLQTKDGGELILREYKSTAKEYFTLRNISVWLKK